MSNINIRALLGVPKHANQHRLSRLTMEVHTSELRIMASAVESYTDELIAALEVAEKRIAELERSETQLIDERDNAESALNDAYKAVMGQAPEWSNWFSFADAIDEIELACGLWRNQTEDVIQFRARIAELEEREELFQRAKALMHQSGGTPIENSLNPVDAWLYDAENAAAGKGEAS
jgi:chromosome condensin MukBEF ATPase and DNA-binding subunit MukB